MSAETDRAAQRVAAVINKTGCLEVVKWSSSNEQMAFLCRFSDEVRWFRIMEYFLLREKGWKSFIGKKYFSNEAQSAVVAGWSLNFQSPDIIGASERISGLLLNGIVVADGGVPNPEGAGLVDFEVVEAPYYNPAGANRNMPRHEGGRGASPILGGRSDRRSR